MRRDATTDAGNPSWALPRELLARAARHEAWDRAASWALDVLEDTLGHGWYGRAYREAMARREGLPLVSELNAIGANALSSARVLEWALRLWLLADVPGLGDLRQDLRSDVQPGRILHTDLQLQLAALALRRGWDVAVEPKATGAPPADVQIFSPNGPVLIEARVLTERDASRVRRRRISDASSELMLWASAHRVWMEGTLGDPDEPAVSSLKRWVAREALSVRAGYKPEYRRGAISVRLVRQEEAGEALRSSDVREDLGPRMMAAIAEKAGKMPCSGAEWLRITVLTGLFGFTKWAQKPLAEKLTEMVGELSRALGDRTPPGIVVSSAAALHPGDVPEESAVDGVAVALRRAVAPLRARETLIIPFSDDLQAGVWEELAEAERDWLAWALTKAGLPALDEIFRPTG